MSTIYVSPTGSDSNSGASTSQSLRTITAARTLAIAGDTVLVDGDTNTPYYETVSQKVGVAFKGAPGTRPCVDGQFIRDTGFGNSGSMDGGRVEGFEVRNALRAGIYANVGVQGQNANYVIHDCWIHHCYSAQPFVNGIYLGFGNTRVTDCEISHIGNRNEAMGIWMWRCNNAVIDSNLIYLCRKSCIRDGTGLSNQFTNNQLYQAWAAGECSVGVGGLWANNILGFCTYSFWMKHSNQNGLAIWGLTEAPAKYRFWHNTMYRPMETCMSIGGDPVNGGYTRDFSIKNNIFVGGGHTAPWQVGGATQTKCGQSFLYAAPSTILDGGEVDFNAYATQASGFNRPPAVYREGSNTPYVLKELPALRTDIGWELNGADLDPKLNDIDNLDFDYPDTSPVKDMGDTLDSPWGDQMGARGLTPPRIRWTQHNMMGHSKTWSAGVWLGMFDERAPSSSVWTATPGVDAVIIDLGATKDVTHFYQLPVGGSSFNVKGHRWESSADATGPWTTLIETEYADSGATMFWEEIPGGGIQCRYLRFTFLSNFGGSLVGATELGAANLTFGGAPDPDPPPAPTTTRGAYLGIGA